MIPTIRIKSTHPESQGEFVEINESDFDPAKGHERYVAPPPSPAPSKPAELPKTPADPLANLAANWRDKDADELRKLAAAIGGRAVENKEQAIQVIEAALAAKK